MSYVEKSLRFTLPVVIVLCVLQLGVLALFKTDAPPTIAEIPVFSMVNEFQAKLFNWFTSPFHADGRTKTAKFLSGLSLEKRQQFLKEYGRRLTKELHEVDYTDLAAPIIHDFVEDMNERGVYFE